MRLYAFYRSSASYRVRLGLAHKDIAHELVPIALMTGEQRAPEHRARNPIGQVPVLELLGGEQPVLLAQSVAILEYLEEVFPEPALLPREPIARARVRELVELVNSGIQPLQNLSVSERRTSCSTARRSVTSSWMLTHSVSPGRSSVVIVAWPMKALPSRRRLGMSPSQRPRSRTPAGCSSRASAPRRG